MGDPDLEALTTPRIESALVAAVRNMGKEDFAKRSGIDIALLNRVLDGNEEYIPVAILTLACQINKSNNDTEISHTSITECLKGAILRLPPKESRSTIPSIETSSTPRSRREQFLKSQRQGGRLYDPSVVRILGFGVNLFTFLVLGYFLGGLVLGPLLGLSSCFGVVARSPWLDPCLGSGVGLVFGSIAGVAYTYYYFVRKV